MEILGKDKNTREGIAIGNAGNLCTGLPDGNDNDGDNGDGDDGDGDSGVGDPRKYRKALTGLHFRHMRAFVPCSTQLLTAVKIVLQAQRMIFLCAVQQLQIETRVNESKLEVNDNLLEIDL